MSLELDHWLPDPGIRVVHRRESVAEPARLWDAARQVRLAETGMLGRLVRWRIPGTSDALAFDELFRNPPFLVLDDPFHALVSGLVGRIWTLRRDYPRLRDPDEFRGWSAGGTARVLFANWIEENGDGGALVTEVRVQAFGTQGRLGIAAVRPLIRSFHALIGSEGIEAAVRAAERR